MADEAPTAKRTTFSFKAEISQLLDILAHSLYKDREIFLRELISNAADALTRIRFEMLTNQEILDPEAELAVHISVEEKDNSKQIVVRDTGIGMNHEELITNLGTIAQSGAREFLAHLKDQQEDSAEIIGQFGVGFYSVFMVAEEVSVVSRSYRVEDEAAIWTSGGGDEFVIGPSEKADRGTEIIISLKEDAEEYADLWKIRQIVKRHSDYVGYPIYVDGEQANQQRPLWRKAPGEVTEEEYRQFYQQFTMDFEEPLSVIHLSSDAPVHVRALLFIPARREKSVLNMRQNPGLRLYSHNVMIQDYSEDLLPKWLEFVDGVVDSEDLPLNVSRENIQNTRFLRQLAKVVRRRVIKELSSLAENEPGKYGEFWLEFGRVLKEGLATDPGEKDDILEYFRFYSSKSKGKLTSLDAYVETMQDDQQAIYYALGDSKQAVELSPHLDPFKERELEVLYFTDPVDPFILPLISEYEGRQLRNVDDPDLEFSELTDDESLEEDETPRIEEADFNRLVGRFVTVLGDRITEVRESKVLRSSPVRLVPPENAPDRSMQRISRFLDKDYEVPKRIFEINRRHSFIVDLAKIIADRPEDELINLSIEQLYENALIIEGLHPDPSAMLPTIQRLLEVAAERTAFPDGATSSE